MPPENSTPSFVVVRNKEQDRNCLWTLHYGILLLENSEPSFVVVRNKEKDRNCL